MSHVVVPVRYPLTVHSKNTLSKAIEIARERDAELTVLHVDLYHNSHNVTRSELKQSVEAAFDTPRKVRYAVRKGFLVEETILEEVASEAADVVVIGHKQAGRWRSMIRKLVDDPDVESYLRDRVDCELVTVRAN
ncbi:Universal stress protein family protein [Natronoarchaeum philippinense]|uniref:Universal stress protein family protein n=1 Tax=Natronoarchaeum philippinense TaxID=558529 RepID=A0A285N600_NATPI|nr:universal stress protein [Natronoarchaeum philippinense]SNZ04297.1 Universal stress protein family protein [Natronoarchaeum philippinense]